MIKTEQVELVGILYSNDTIEVVELNEYWKEAIEESEKDNGCYLWEDVVLCVGKDPKKIESKLKKFIFED
jgi:hypothetical protein